VITKRFVGTYHYRYSDSDSGFGASVSRRSAYSEHLVREKLRASRSNIAVSTIVVSITGSRRHKLVHIRRFCSELQTILRETDGVYVVDNWTVGAILPLTDRAGAERLAQKLERRFGRHGLFIHTETFDAMPPRQRSVRFLSAPRFDVKAALDRLPQQSELAALADFAKQIRMEKRRTDRSKSPFSLLMVNAEPGERSFDGLVEAILPLTRHCSEIDAVGRLGPNTIGLIMPHTDRDEAERIRRRLEFAGGLDTLKVQVATYPDHVFDRHRSQELQTVQAEHCPFVKASFIESDRVQSIAKRAVDVVGALVGLAVFAPVMAITALAVKLTSPGPVIFQQTRIGAKGVPFSFYKFRSMRVDNDDRIHRDYVKSLIQGKHTEVDQGGGAQPLYKLKADPRITAVGSFIRKTSLDELPQFFNVLKGDMSLVGPRPPLPYEVEQYQSWHLRRVLDVKPGITGLWQVEGRSRTSFDDMVRLDLQYSSKASLGLDFLIMLRTFKSVVQSSGAC